MGENEEVRLLNMTIRLYDRSGAVFSNSRSDKCNRKINADDRDCRQRRTGSTRRASRGGVLRWIVLQVVE